MLSLLSHKTSKDRFVINQMTQQLHIDSATAPGITVINVIVLALGTSLTILQTTSLIFTPRRLPKRIIFKTTLDSISPPQPILKIATLCASALQSLLMKAPISKIKNALHVHHFLIALTPNSSKPSRPLGFASCPASTTLIPSWLPPFTTTVVPWQAVAMEPYNFSPLTIPYLIITISFLKCPSP